MHIKIKEDRKTIPFGNAVLDSGSSLMSNYSKFPRIIDIQE
jgi:hypothetical protein